MMNVEPEDEIVLFVKLGYDGQSLGACHQSQRVHMLSRLKVSFAIVEVNFSLGYLFFFQLSLDFTIFLVIAFHKFDMALLESPC